MMQKCFYVSSKRINFIHMKYKLMKLTYFGLFHHAVF